MTFTLASFHTIVRQNARAKGKKGTTNHKHLFSTVIMGACPVALDVGSCVPRQFDWWATVEHYPRYGKRLGQKREHKCLLKCYELHAAKSTPTVAVTWHFFEDVSCFSECVPGLRNNLVAACITIVLESFIHRILVAACVRQYHN